MYLFPHMLIRFNSLRNKFLKNADRIRVDSVSDLNYSFLSFFSSEEEFIQDLSNYSFSPELIKLFL